MNLTLIYQCDIFFVKYRRTFSYVNTVISFSWITYWNDKEGSLLIMNINEIANLAGVSRATVSRYLNNGYVSKDKKNKIQKVIEETGYKPSSYAQTLRNKKTNLIGVIIPKINSDSISRIVSGISQILSDYNYQLLLACTENHEDKEVEYLNLFRDNHVDGIILFGTIFSEAHMKALSQLAVPVVVIGQNIPNYACVYHEDFNAAKELTASLIPKGSRFGYLCADLKDIAVGKNRRDGFCKALETAGIPADFYFISNADITGFSIETGYQQAKAMMTNHPDVDTLICATDTLAVGAMNYLQEQEISIPETVQIAGLNDSVVSHVTSPSLTTVHFYYEEAGKEAADSLIAQIRSSEHTVRKSTQLGYQILKQNSTR